MINNLGMPVYFYGYFFIGDILDKSLIIWSFILL